VIALARHGETAFNHDRRFQGHLPVPLNERGREQARELAELCVPEGFVAMYCSPLLRTRQTAEIVAERIGLEPVIDERFAETDCGDWTNKLWTEIEAEDPEGFAAWLRAGDAFRFPGGESFREQLARVADGLADVTQRGELPALVVCHGGVIRCARARTDPRGLAAWHDYDVPNGSLYRP
jgi:broad specificity phosphatase PhoE